MGTKSGIELVLTLVREGSEKTLAMWLEQHRSYYEAKPARISDRSGEACVALHDLAAETVEVVEKALGSCVSPAARQDARERAYSVLDHGIPTLLAEIES